MGRRVVCVSHRFEAVAALAEIQTHGAPGSSTGLPAGTIAKSVVKPDAGMSPVVSTW